MLTPSLPQAVAGPEEVVHAHTERAAHRADRIDFMEILPLLVSTGSAGCRTIPSRRGPGKVPASFMRTCAVDDLAQAGSRLDDGWTHAIHAFIGIRNEVAGAYRAHARELAPFRHPLGGARGRRGNQHEFRVARQRG